jgi:putative thioredoxin
MVAEALLRQALAMQPGHVDATLDLAERVIARGALDDAQVLLDRVPAGSRNDRHAALAKRIELARNKPPGDPAALAARIAANPKDHEARFALAALQVYEGDFNAAFDPCWRWCCATRPTGARRRVCSWSTGSRPAATPRP